jgi:hypothetical protein
LVPEQTDARRAASLRQSRPRPNKGSTHHKPHARHPYKPSLVRRQWRRLLLYRIWNTQRSRRCELFGRDSGESTLGRARRWAQRRARRADARCCRCGSGSTAEPGGSASWPWPGSSWCGLQSNRKGAPGQPEGSSGLAELLRGVAVLNACSSPRAARWTRELVRSLVGTRVAGGAAQRTGLVRRHLGGCGCVVGGKAGERSWRTTRPAAAFY